jgi:hypothetical protein
MTRVTDRAAAESGKAFFSVFFESFRETIRYEIQDYIVLKKRLDPAEHHRKSPHGI